MVTLVGKVGNSVAVLLQIYQLISLPLSSICTLLYCLHLWPINVNISHVANAFGRDDSLVDLNLVRYQLIVSCWTTIAECLQSGLFGWGVVDWSVEWWCVNTCLQN